MQTNGCIRIASRITVFQIAFNGASDMGQLATDLMVAACHEVDFKKGVVVGVGESAVFQDSLLRIRLLLVVGIGFVLFLVANEPVL